MYVSLGYFAKYVRNLIKSSFLWHVLIKTSRAIFGYEESARKLKEIGKAEVNNHGIFIRFTCMQTNEIWQYGRNVLKEVSYL